MKEFLDSINEGQLIENFIKNEVTYLEDIKELTADDLKDELLIPLGPRKRILKAIAGLNDGIQTKQGPDALEESAVVDFGSVSKDHIKSGANTLKLNDWYLQLKAYLISQIDQWNKTSERWKELKAVVSSQ